MKQQIKLQKWIPSGVLALILAGSTSTAFGSPLTDWLVDDFSEGNVSQVMVTETGPSGNMVNDAIVTYDGAVGKPAGSCYVELDWPVAGNGGQWEDCKIDWDLPGWPGTDITVYQSIDFDLKVDTANSTLFSDGTFGSVSAIPQSWTAGGWYGLGGAAIQNTTAWQHFSIPIGTTLPVPYPVNRLNLDFYSNPPQNALGTVKFWIDNVTIKAPPSNIKPTMGTIPNAAPITKAIPGLNVSEVTEGNSFYDRQSLELLTSSGLSWVGNTAGGPVSYSFTIVGYPNSANCEAYMFLVPNAAGNEGGADWNEANAVVISLQGTPSSATMHFQYKVNEPNQEAMLGGGTETRGSYTNAPGSWDGITPNYLESGNLGSVTNNGTGVYGTWTITFTSDTAVTLTGPGPEFATSSFTFPSYNTHYFAESTGFNIYLGMQANQADGMNQPVVFGNFAVTGVPSAYSENFLAETALDTVNVWNKGTCSQPLAALIVPASDAGGQWVNWTIPDSGFTLAGSPTLNNAVWSNAAGMVTPLFGGRQGLVSPSALPGAKDGFYLLIQRTFTQLQVLLPGETAAPNTPSGKTGTPDVQVADHSFNVIINAVDNNWNGVNATDDCGLTSPDAGFIVLDPTDTNGNGTNLANGTATLSVEFLFDGSSQITAVDADNNSITSGVSSTVTY